MGSYEPPQKKARPFEANANGFADLNVIVNGNNALDLAQLNGGDLECRRYNTPEGCPYGTKCRFKHGPADDRDLGIPPTSALGSKTKPCTKFFSTSGCPYGEGCHFLHYVPGGIIALGMGTGVSSPNLVPGGVINLVGPVSPAGAQVPAASTYADPSVTVGGYKTRLCNRFITPEGCRFGEKCHFAHGESDLRPSNGRSNGRTTDYTGQAIPGSYLNGFPSQSFLSTAVASAIYYGEPTPPGVTTGSIFGATSTTKISIEAAFAGAIIGKAGSNVKQISRLTGAKLSIREHETDANMRNVEMEGSLEQIEHASEMVRQFMQNREVVAPRQAALGSHNFKTKMCENFVQGTCTFADRCHFAHGAHELRVPTVMR